MLQPMLACADNNLMSELGDDLRAFLITVWHCRNFVKGRAVNAVLRIRQWRSVTFSTGYSIIGCGWVWPSGCG